MKWGKHGEFILLKNKYENYFQNLIFANNNI